MASSTWIAIVVGGAAGAAAAFLAAPDPAPPELAPAAARPVPTPTPTRAASPPSAPPAAAAAGSSEWQPGTTAAPPGGSAGAAASAEPAPAVPAVRSREELARLEIACQEKREPAACRSAARAYEEGGVAPADPAKARLFRRIELTFLVRQCEGQIASACAVLAERYETGEGVTQSTRSAEALRARVKELCANRKGEGCPE